MTFSDTLFCLFCGKPRIIEVVALPKPGLTLTSRVLKSLMKKIIQWNTLLSVFYLKEQHEWEDKKGKPHRSGWVVTVCRECRKTKTVEDLIKAAKEVY